MRICAKVTTLFTTAALTALAGGLVAATATTASASPGVPSAGQHVVAKHAVKAAIAHPDVAGPADAYLSALSVTGNEMTGLAPAFDPGTHDYEVNDNDDLTATVTPTVDTVGATAVVSSADGVDPLVSGAATVALTRGRNDITVTVTSSDSTATSAYVVTVWRLAAPKSQIVQLAGATSTVFGGARMTVTLSDGALPSSCGRFYEIGDRQVGAIDSTFDPATSLTTDIVTIPESDTRTPGTVDLEVVNYCFGFDENFVYGESVVKNAVTYTAGFTVTSADVPATVTSGSAIVVHGSGVTAGADIDYWITTAPGSQSGLQTNDGGSSDPTLQQLNTWEWTGSDNSTVYVNYPYGNPWYKGSGPRTLHVGYCPLDSEGIDSTCTSVFSKTINWVTPTPSNVSFSPSSGPVSGGTKISLKGRFIVSGTEDLSVKVGAQNVPDWTTTAEATNDDDSFLTYTQGQDVITFPAPPASAPGPVSITVTNDIGSTVARGTFTYSALPTITSIVPAKVANSGGSVITVKGTAFGAVDNPTVIIDGVKSSFVTRISATQLTAVVPAEIGTTGAVDVSVSSSQGGGISAPATLTLVTPTTLPTVTKIVPASGHVSDDVTLTGTAFGAAGTPGVTVDGQGALVTASTATSITFEVPATNTSGVKDLVVSATTGAVTKTNGFTVLADDGITTVSPATVPSYATGVSATVALDGSGFGTTGTVKVGTAAAVAYTATAAGTHIAGVAVSTAVAASLPIVVTPHGSKTPLQASVFVTGPVLTYVGPDPRDAAYGTPDIDTGKGGQVLAVPLTGGATMRVEGSGFGPAGVLTVGGAPLATTTWSDTLVTFTAPAHAAGTVALTLTPTGSVLSAARAAAVEFVVPAVGYPTIARIASVVDYGHNDRNEFDPPNDVSSAFTVTGTNLAGDTASATTITISDGADTFTVVPTSVTATSFTFAAPRGFTNAGWKNIEVDTDVGSVVVNYGMYYDEAGVQLDASPNAGLCLRATTAATGSVSYDPAVVTVTNSGDLFGDAGSVSIDGVAVAPTQYTDSSITFSMASLATDLAQPWGAKSIVVTPDDSSLAPSSVGFTCGVTPSVTTTVNGATDPVTVAAGTAYTLGYTTAGFLGDPGFSATAPDDYEYVTAADFTANGFNSDVQAGTPVAAGDYYIRVALSRATYANEDYLGFTPSAVHVTITGSPVTITPVSDNGSSFTYKGQLTDGTDSSPVDFHYTATATADPITGVTWQYRDSVCESQDPNEGWINGLPKDVARSDPGCGGDGTTVSSWDVRVASFEMDTSGTDRSIYYQATLPTTQITITPRNVTVTAVRADRVYNGTNVATLGDLTVTGGIDGDDIALANPSVGGTFANANAGVNKPVTLSQDLALAGQAASDYVLTNPRPTIVGTITKASATLSLAASASSVVLSQHTPVTITPTVEDTSNNVPVDGTSAAVVLTSKTPTICTISGTTMTAVKAGTCTVGATEAASTNYTAATAESDSSSTTETIDIDVFPAPQAISVVADDFTAAVGDELDPTSQVSGLFDGDSVDGIDYSYYSGATLLVNPPTAVGIYKVVPSGGTLTAANTAVYSNPTSFTYVAGTLTITALPPTITTFSPTTGPTAGGTKVTITGTLLNTVQSVRIGAVTLRAGAFTVNQAGTTLSFKTPKVAKPGQVPLVLVDGTATTSDVYTYTKPPTPPVLGAPTHEGAAGHNLKIVVTFTPPASDGGAAISSYQFSTNGGKTWHTVTTKAGAHGTRTATLTGLKNGVTYKVEVRAVNSRGVGAASKSSVVVPNAPPLGKVRPISASQVPVPKHPKRYRGPRKVTTAFDTTQNGTWAHPIPDLGTRQLTIGEAATLAKSSLFGFNSAVLTKAGHAEVKLLAGHLRLANKVSCEGYTDYAGAAHHERTLSEGRAEAVCKALVHDGAHVTFTTHGYGGARPVVIGGSAPSRAANRRVVVIVTA